MKTLRLLSFAQGTALNLMRVLLLALMIYLIYAGAITLGQFFSLMFYSFFIFQPLGELGNLIAKVQETRSSLENYNRILAKKPEPEPADAKVVQTIDQIEFKQVSFTHQATQQHALDEVSFTAKRGQSIAFVGPSGAGKSTLLKLLIGLYLPKKGLVLINDQPTSGLNSASVRQKIGLVPQSIELFAGTIKDNLLFVKPTATDKECLAVLKQAQLDNLLQRAGHGLSTKIGEGGMKISGGERQRLAIARALLRAPEVLIFDEATSSLDSATEAEITKTIREITDQGSHMITILVAHRLSTIAHADQIMVLEKGRLVEQGTHRVLLAQKGLYY
ncbi:MAG: ABC transporter ATP-binding protein, partial [bacterium]|nr:ABC transporter ATP-binding protein [bacterium]